MQVAYFHRKPTLGCYSLEKYFASVREHLPGDIKPVVRESSFTSRGVLRRVYNIVEASLRQGDINHITGDVHILSYLMKRERTVLTIADCTPLHRSQGLRRALLKALWYDLPLLRSTRITVISESVKRDLLDWCPISPGRIHVIPVHISDIFRPHPPPAPSDCLRVLQVGTAPNKNIERLARALSGLRCRLDCIGKLSSSQREALEKAGVPFTESSELSDEAVVDMYANCDLVSFASTMEGFGIPILEANAVGRPVVTSNVASMPEVAGSAACLVDPFQPDSIREGIQKVAEDENYRRSLVEAGYENVKRYRVESIVQSYVSLYRSLYFEG